MKKIEINNIILPLDASHNEILRSVAKKISINFSDITDLRIKRRSVDARRNNINFNYCVELDVPDNFILGEGAKEVQEPQEEQIVFGTMPLNYRPIIIGCGPAGLFCAYELAQNGYKPIIIERGQDIDNRVLSVENFIKTGELNTSSNIQFGEGGAGTFSDGKLTTRINDDRCDKVIDTFIKCGADEAIGYLAKPHIGTDVLRGVIKNLREKIIALGGEFRFESLLEDITIKNNKISSITINQDDIGCEILILAIGHSARDTYKMLYDKNILLQQKAFAIGFRIEHLQSFIDESQYGNFAGHPALGAADYRLAYNGNNRSCFSFCMCPGGSVVAATSEEGGVVVNGMSNNARDGKNANSAIVVSVNTNDYDGVLGGINLQKEYEKAAFNLTGSYLAPVSNTKDFIDNVSTKNLKIRPTYPLGYEKCDLHKCMPKFVNDTICEAMGYFDKRIKGFTENSIMTGVETRTSSPVRILRNGNMESINISGLYPIGEGAGYAGGIMSAAVDGIKGAEEIMKKYKPIR